MPTYALCPPFWARTAAPIHCVPVSCVDVTWTTEYWSLANEPAVHVSPVSTPAVPVTCWEAIAIAPSAIAVQFAPRPPSARLKSSDADVAVLAVQDTATLVTLAEPTVPDPLDTVHVCPDGFVFTVTLYGAPLGSAVANVNDPFAVTLRLSPPLSCSTTVPDSPETVPPTVNDPPVFVVQDTATFVTLAEPTVPDPLDTVHVCPDGFVFTVTLYGAPLGSAVANVNDPFAVTLRLSPPLSCSTTVPDSPETVPPTVNDAAFPPDQLSAVALPKAIMPGAPPVNVLSVTEIRLTPFCQNEIVLPTAATSSCVPAASGPLLYVPPSCVQLLVPVRLNSCSTGLPLFQL